jgi:hypothetical protein
VSLADLDLILSKEAIIATFPAAHLRSQPEHVEHVYRSHARTHIPLGDTGRFVDRIFQWVGGVNKGAFVGAVVGNYGEGKTSFQVHVWDESARRQIFAVPPFQWNRLSDLIDATANWIDYILKKNYPETAHEAHAIYTQFRERSLRELAESIAANGVGDVDSIIRTLKAAMEAGGSVNTDVTPERFLDYCARVTEVLSHAGYVGLLVLVDEPEVAAKELGQAKVAQILFDIANGLLQRQGNYGVFLSLPENFYAAAASMFASLPARLEARGCCPRLSDLYGDDFASNLWRRYVETFDLGSEGERIVTPEALVAIGQVGSSARTDLSYGPRTVVSAFSRMVYRYCEEARPYTPVAFTDDVLDGEVLVKHDYPSRIRELLRSPELPADLQDTVKLLAAFPNGLSEERAQQLGIEQVLRDLAYHGRLVRKRGQVFYLDALRKPEGPGTTRDELRDTVQEIMSEFAPSREAFSVAQAALVKHVLPMVFEPRQGQQLVGWEEKTQKTQLKSVFGDTIAAVLQGAFRRTYHEYPRRCVAVAVGPSVSDPRPVIAAVEHADPTPDILLHLQVRWNAEEVLPSDRVVIAPGDAAKSELGMFRLTVDLAGEPVLHDALRDAVEPWMLTPLGALYLIGNMDRRTLTVEYKAQWESIREMLLRELLPRLLAEPNLREQAEQHIGEPLPSGPSEFLASVCRWILHERYPDYVTLIRQAHWESRIDQYIQVLNDARVPLACKRGREPWVDSEKVITSVFKNSLMNLTGGAFADYESLIKIRTRNREKDREKLVEIVFRVHPLEQAIMDRIMAESKEKRLVLNGRECWWLPYRKLQSLFRSSGYQLEEIEKIVQIGAARGTFRTGKHEGQHILYCEPLDLDQMRVQLRTKLDELTAQIDLLSQLPDFNIVFDRGAFAAEIEALEDELAYEKLSRTLADELSRCAHAVPGYYQRLAQEFAALRRRASDQRTSLNQAAQVIHTIPSSVSRWGSDLGTYIGSNLKRMVQESAQRLEEASRNAEQASSRYQDRSSISLRDRITRLIEGWRSARDLGEEIAEQEAESKRIMQYLRDYDNWRQLLNESDRVHQGLLDLKNDPSHADIANTLFTKEEELWSQISHYLQTRNVTGLDGYKYFQELIRGLDRERTAYIGQLKSQFDREKEALNSALHELGLGPEERLQEAFNRDDLAGCYKRLRISAAKLVREALNVEQNDVVVMSREVQYSRDVVAQLPTETADPLLAQLQSAAERLRPVIESIGDDWAHEVLDEQRHAAEVHRISAVLEDAREAIRAAKRVLRQMEQSTLPLSAAAQCMLNFLPTSGTTDLKALILQLMSEGYSSEQLLDTSLEALGLLFRAGKVQIKVELPRR